MPGAGRGARDLLAGAEESVVDLAFDGSTSEAWGNWLSVPLEEAVRSGGADLALNLMAAGASVGSRLLFSAVSGGDERIVAAMLDRGASPLHKDEQRNAPIHVAVDLGRQEIVQLLLREGADKDALDRYGRPPLHLAAKHGNVPVVEALLAAGADVSRRDYFDRSALDCAARFGHAKAAATLILRGADVNARNIVGFTPLSSAASSQRVDAIHALLAAGAHVDSRDNIGRTPLHEAARRGCSAAVRALLQAGAKVNAQGNHGESPLHLAARKAGIDDAVCCVDLLLRWGADETIVNDKGEAPADVIGIRCAQDRHGRKDFPRVRDLLEKAPADRAWRRRCLLVMCRWLPPTAWMKQKRDENGEEGPLPCRSPKRPKEDARRTAGSSGVSNDTFGGPTEGGGKHDGLPKSDLDVSLTWTVGLKEEGIFRKVVGYL